jgi:choline dehydrogenase
MAGCAFETWSAVMADQGRRTDTARTAESFDYVIVGGGSAGSVLAYRLSEADKSVCVLEAGPFDTNRYIRVPAGFTKTLFDPAVTFQYLTDPVPGLNGRRVPITQGRVIGGSSSVNGMVFNRGQAFDFDHWERLGNRGWSYGEVLPYFKRLETRIGPGDDRYRGRSGPLPITSNDWPHPLCDAFIEGAKAVGFAWNDDYNGASHDGVGYYQRAIRDGKRVSAAHAFLHPARARGVEIRTDALVERISLEGGRAAGVDYLQGGSQPKRATANEAVIVAAGVTQSPKLLQLSGIGPGALLAAFGIRQLCDLPGVGENLRDHFSPRLVARVKGVDSLNSRAKGVRLLTEIARWLLGKASILALAPALVHGFGRTDPRLETTDFSLVFAPGSYKQGFIGVLDDFDGLTCGAWQMRPESAGYVRITSPDPRRLPAVMPNYLDDERDRRTLVAALKIARSVLNSNAMRRYVEAEVFPGPAVQSDDEWLEFARRSGNSSYHLIGSCHMGPRTDTTAVVDAQLRVHGLEGLYVIDASVMPTVPSANTYAATLMIAEKGADSVLGRRPLEAQLATDTSDSPPAAAHSPAIV